DAVAEVGLWVRRRLDDENLIGANAEMAVCQGAGALRRHLYGLAHAVEHDKVVTGTVQFREVPHHLCIIERSGPVRRCAGSVITIFPNGSRLVATVYPVILGGIRPHPI